MTEHPVLAYLYGLQMFGIKLGLETVRQLLAALGQPQRRYRVIHVAGTNGKGSVCAFLAAICRQAGYRVGLYTSPHLHCFSERIQVDGEPITLESVATLTERLRALSGGLRPTFFEFTTVLALEYFAEQQVDLAIVEVGMGGRLDATNVVEPLVTVITPVSRDHQAHLGETLQQIAEEKAGILKKAVPAVVGPQRAEVAALLQRRCAEQAVPLSLFGRDFAPLAPLPQDPPGSLRVRTPAGLSPVVLPSLAGRHQWDNLATALMVVTELRRLGLQFPDAALTDGAARACWPGRLEWWPAPTASGGLLLDGAHNEAGATVLADYLRQQGYGAGRRRVRWLAGFKSDKDVPAVLEPLASLCCALYAVPIPQEQSFSPGRLGQLAQLAGVPAQLYDDVAEGLRQAQGQRQPDELVLVAGSLFLVAAVREILMAQEGP